VHDRAVEDTFTAICSASVLIGLAAWWRATELGKPQTPDSHDWLETCSPAPVRAPGLPAGMSQHELGVQDHLSIGVVSVDAAFNTSGRQSPDRVVAIAHQIGKDGKGNSTFTTRRSAWN